MTDPVIGRRRFADGTVRPVYLDQDRGQYIRLDDGTQVFGWWLKPGARTLVSDGVANPWPALVVGVSAVALAFLLTMAFGPNLGWLPFFLLVAGSVAVGAGVALRPASPIILGVAACAAFLGCLERSQAGWDSGARLLAVLSAIALAAGVILFLPTSARRVVVSLLVVYHFGGILTIATPARQAWVPSQLWTYVYRPYLQFMFLNYGYDYYAPEPGPTYLLWFHVQYEDYPKDMRNYRWVRIPDYNATDGIFCRPDGQRIWPHVELTRRLELSDSTSIPHSGPLNLEASLQARLDVSWVIPPHLEIPVSNQYYEPNGTSKRRLRSYVRHVARTYSHEWNPELKVTGIKVYRVVHKILSAGDIAEGVDPDDPTTYYPYYMGEFDPDGNMKVLTRKVVFHEDGSATEIQRDPLLYWLIPIMKVPVEEPKDHDEWFRTKPSKTKTEPTDNVLVDFLSIHAGDIAKPEWIKIKGGGKVSHEVTAPIRLN
jgi:hypothetical protein